MMFFFAAVWWREHYIIYDKRESVWKQWKIEPRKKMEGKYILFGCDWEREREKKRKKKGYTVYKPNGLMNLSIFCIQK